MKTIHKYPVPIRDELTLLLPQNPLVLCVQMQGDSACIWAEVNTDNRPVPYSFYWRGTGHPLMARGDRYIGTVQIQILVFHLFVQKGVDVGFETPPKIIPAGAP